MKTKLNLILGIFFMAGTITDAVADAKYVKIETLSGIEAEVISVAVAQFHSEKLNITPNGYDISLYLNEGQYIVIFERSKNAALNTINPRYEVVISSQTFEVIQKQFSR